MSDFADMMWLFTSVPTTRGKCRLNIGEAALLWRQAKRAVIGMVEIGRKHGGSLCLMSAANPDVWIVSIDRVAMDDQDCIDFLKDRHVHVATGDSQRFEHYSTYDLAFIDGDHSYEGVKADVENLWKSLAPEAILLFHDAVAGAYGSCKGVTKFTDELSSSGQATVIATTDSMLVMKLT